MPSTQPGTHVEPAWHRAADGSIPTEASRVEPEQDDPERKTDREEPTEKRADQPKKVAHSDRLVPQAALEEDPLGTVPAELEEQCREHDSQPEERQDQGMVTRKGPGDDAIREEPHRERDERHRRLADERLRRRSEVRAEADPRRQIGRAHV